MNWFSSLIWWLKVKPTHERYGWPAQKQEAATNYHNRDADDRGPVLGILSLGKTEGTDEGDSTTQPRKPHHVLLVSLQGRGTGTPVDSPGKRVDMHCSSNQAT